MSRALRVARAEARRGGDLHVVGGELPPDLPPDGVQGPRPREIVRWLSRRRRDPRDELVPGVAARILERATSFPLS